MAVDTNLDEEIQETEHQAAYIFNPHNDDVDGLGRPTKRRKVSKKHSKAGAANGTAIPSSSGSSRHFRPLLNGVEDESTVQLRQSLFEQPWARIETRIQKVLRDANHKTLDEVVGYLKSAPQHIPNDRIPAAFIITGPSMASQDLLFEQLSESVHSQTESLVVRLRSGDVTNLRSALTKLIQSATSKSSLDEEDAEVTTSKDGRKFLKYDLEALHVYLKHAGRRNVVIVFQDSEGFDGGLLSDLISLLHSWLDRISFALVFGVATSVELFQARLLKSTCRRLHGAQFDVEQSALIVDRIFKVAIAHADAPIRFGASLIRTLLDRQRDQVASIPVFVSSLRYLHMCHFYANPISFILSNEVDGSVLKQEHFDTLRSLPSFRNAVDSAIEQGDTHRARKLLEDDTYLSSFAMESAGFSRVWHTKLLRKVKMMASIEEDNHAFTELYLETLAQGMKMDAQESDVLGSVRRKDPAQVVSMLSQLLDTIKEGDEALGLSGWASDDHGSVESLESISAAIQDLQSRSQANGHILRSKYSSQNKLLRTTVVAQKVQLSRDTATLTDEDKEYTGLSDRLVNELQSLLRLEAAEDLAFHEIWLYDSRVPHKDVFIPRPRAVIERALSQPHDYLSCSCCKSEEGHLASTLPATAILYQLYLETGSLINVADLWTAFFGIVGEDKEGGLDERTALVQFYRALAELKTMGFVKQTRKKADHIAKLAWKGL